MRYQAAGGVFFLSQEGFANAAGLAIYAIIDRNFSKASAFSLTAIFTASQLRIRLSHGAGLPVASVIPTFQNTGVEQYGRWKDK